MALGITQEDDEQLRAEPWLIAFPLVKPPGNNRLHHPEPSRT